jgi:gluconolactonase
MNRRQLFRIAGAAPLAAGAARSQSPAPEEVEIAATVSFTEGPTVDAEGNVYFTETRSQRIMRLSTAGELSVFRENSNGANGLIFDSAWRLLACEGSRSRPRVTRTDLKTGRIEVLAERYGGKPLNGPNDLSFDAKGRVYFTDPAVPSGTSAVYRIDPDGRIDQILVSPEIQRPNGIVISGDDRTLYLVESNPVESGARMIRAYNLEPGGRVRNMRVHYNFYPGRSADGMSIDVEGNLYAAAGLHRRRGTSETLDTRPGIHVISPRGRVSRYVPIPEDTITNCAFGGPDMKTLYVTAGKTLFKLRTEVAGTRR